MPKSNFQQEWKETLSMYQGAQVTQSDTLHRKKYPTNKKGSANMNKKNNNNNNKDFGAANSKSPSGGRGGRGGCGRGGRGGRGSGPVAIASAAAVAKAPVSMKSLGITKQPMKPIAQQQNVLPAQQASPSPGRRRQRSVNSSAKKSLKKNPNESSDELIEAVAKMLEISSTTESFSNLLTAQQVQKQPASPGKISLNPRNVDKAKNGILDGAVDDDDIHSSSDDDDEDEDENKKPVADSDSDEDILLFGAKIDIPVSSDAAATTKKKQKKIIKKNQKSEETSGAAPAKKVTKREIAESQKKESCQELQKTLDEKFGLKSENEQLKLSLDAIASSIRDRENLANIGSIDQSQRDLADRLQHLATLLLYQPQRKSESSNELKKTILENAGLTEAQLEKKKQQLFDYLEKKGNIINGRGNIGDVGELGRLCRSAAAVCGLNILRDCCSGEYKEEQQYKPLVPFSMLHWVEEENSKGEKEKVQAGVTVDQYKILLHLYNNGFFTNITQIAVLLNISQPAVTKGFQRAEADNRPSRPSELIWETSSVQNFIVNLVDARRQQVESGKVKDGEEKIPQLTIPVFKELMEKQYPTHPQLSLYQWEMAVKRAGLCYLTHKRKLPLLEGDKKNRKRFADFWLKAAKRFKQKYRGKDLFDDFWFFSDESHVRENMYGEREWQIRGAGRTQEEQQKIAGNKITVWAAISARHGIVAFNIFEPGANGFNKEHYIDMLTDKTNEHSWINWHTKFISKRNKKGKLIYGFEDKETGIFRPLLQEDGATAHFNWKCDAIFGEGANRFLGLGWMDEEELEKKKLQDNMSEEELAEIAAADRARVLGWPAHSPDLNPIENLWAAMKYFCRSVKATATLAERKEQILTFLTSQRGNEIAKNCASSFEKRLEKCQKNNGGTTSY